MSNVTALNIIALGELQKSRAPAGYLWCRSTVFADAIDTLYSRLVELCALLSRQLDSIDRLLPTAPDPSRRLELIELAEMSRQRLQEADRLLSEEHDRLAALRQRRFHIYASADEPSDRRCSAAYLDGAEG